MGWTFYNSNGEALVQHAESEATQAEMEAETAGVKFVPPDLIKHSPGVAKAWVNWEQTGAHSIITDGSYNMTSVTDSGAVGNTDHLWNVDMADGSYVIVGMSKNEAALVQLSEATTGATTGTRRIDDATAQDQGNNFIAVFGKQ